jgi:hypothetical protein
MTSTDTHAPARIRHRYPQPNASLLLPDGVKNVPPAVQAANQVAETAHGRLRHARDEQAAKQAAVKAAPHLDRQAAAHASAAGLDVADLERVLPAAQAALADANRAHQAALDSYDNATLQLAAEISEHRDQWLEAHAATVDAARQTVRNLLDKLTEAMWTLDAERRLDAGLREFPEGGSLTVATMGRVLGRQATPEEQRAQAVAALHQADRQGGNFRSMVYRDTPHLLAALALQAEGD